MIVGIHTWCDTRTPLVMLCWLRHIKLRDEGSRTEHAGKWDYALIWLFQSSLWKDTAALTASLPIMYGRPPAGTVVDAYGEDREE